MTDDSRPAEQTITVRVEGYSDHRDGFPRRFSETFEFELNVDPHAGGAQHGQIENGVLDALSKVQLALAKDRGEDGF